MVANSNKNPSAGFTYLSVLFLIVISGIGMAVTGEVWKTEADREKEAELIFRGMEYRDAIREYYDGSPGVKVYPQNLGDLLDDKRSVAKRRYLRKLYADPVTGQFDWELVKAPDGKSIMGVRSSSGKEPIKKNNFPADLTGFENKTKYNEWEFVYIPAGK